MKTVKQLSEEWKTSEQGIRKKLKRYENELKGHTFKDGLKPVMLDEFAVKFLDERRLRQAVTVELQDTSEELEKLKLENKGLLLKVASLQSTVIDLQAESMHLLENKAELERLQSRTLLQRIFNK